MKALTIRQPWASLIAHGEKRIETRSWSTTYRGPIAIHASKRLHHADVEYAFLSEPIREALVRHGVGMFANLSLGSILATATLVDCIRFGDTVDLSGFPDDERRFGDFTAGRYGFVLNDLTLIEPVLAKGALGLWEWEGERAACDTNDR